MIIIIPKEYVDFKYNKITASKIHELFNIICEEEKQNDYFNYDNGYWHEEYDVAIEVVLADESEGFNCFKKEDLIIIFKYTYLGCWGYRSITKLNDDFFKNVINKYIEFRNS